MMVSFETVKRLTLKVGSSLLVDENGAFRHAWLDTLVADIATLFGKGTQLLIVSSGSVALGRPLLNADLSQPNLKQAAAACGQPLLMQAWQSSFSQHGLKSAQILLTLNDTESRRAYLNARNTIRTLLKHGVIPIINENDSVTTEGILYGDNDRLAARIAAMCDADALLLLSDVDGLYTANPLTQPQAEFLELVEEITPQIEAMAGKPGKLGSGGMITKIAAARIATRAGCRTFIANGQQNHPLSHMTRCTEFTAHTQPLAARQRWISGSIQPAGRVTVDAGAVAALAKGSSLLHVGITDLSGEFAEGDTLEIVDSNGTVLAKGLSNLDSTTARQLMGRRSQEIREILGYEAAAELIHRDHMVQVS